MGEGAYEEDHSFPISVLFGLRVLEIEELECAAYEEGLPGPAWSFHRDDLGELRIGAEVDQLFH